MVTYCKLFRCSRCSALGKVLVASLGDCCIDLVFKVAKYPHEGEESQVLSFQESLGGSAANVAVALARLGIKSGFLGKIGKDYFGDLLFKAFLREGVDTSQVYFSNSKRTNIMVIVVGSTGERTIFAYRGAAVEHKPEEISKGYIRKLKLLHISGYSFLEKPQSEAAKKAVYVAKEESIPVSLDLGYFLAEKGPCETKKILKLVDILFPNKEELELISGESRVRKAAEKVLDWGVKVVVVKLGGEGAFLSTKKEHFYLPSLKVKVKDTTGAGDAFDAGFIFGYLEGYTLKESLKIANWCAAQNVQSIGARTGLPFRDQLNDFIRENFKQ